MLAVATAACGDLVEVDAAFYNWDDRTVHCCVEGDAKSGNDIDSILRALDRARDRGEVFELLVHRPGDTMTWEDFETLLAGVNERGLAWITYEDIIDGTYPKGTGGISLQYDGTWLDSWVESMDLLAQYNARVSVFVTRYARIGDDGRARIRQLADGGHDIEPHSVDHRRAPVYVDEHGLTAYLDEEMQPSIDVLRADGYRIVSFAYPFGDRTSEIDEAVARRVPIIRSLSNRRVGITSPCPY